jgi:LmbE family N-acetylglucosaminyl deacetylase
MGSSDSNGLIRYRAVIVSPHLDDAVFSCGGVMSKFLQDGPVLVLNIFTAYRQDLKMHGVMLGAQRQQEELDAAAFMGFESRSLGEFDAPFRRSEYLHIGNIFRPPVAADLAWIPDLRQTVFAELAKIKFDQLLVPLGVGWHVDHVLTHMLFDEWVDTEILLYYEDVSYCCLPHATRYRLNDIGSYEAELHDVSLREASELRAWWHVTTAYLKTALMKNLQPWYVRIGAMPAVGYYLYRLMHRHRLGVAGHGGRVTLKSRVFKLSRADVARKVDAMAVYESQFKEFFLSGDDCLATLQSYMDSFGLGERWLERVWVKADP